jgi:transcriptional regulator with XRE-family HTH domain
MGTRGPRIVSRASLQRLKRPQSYVSKFERGERRLDVVEFLDVAKALRIDPLDLLRQLMQKRPKGHLQ